MSGRNHSPVSILKEDVPVKGVTPVSLENALTWRTSPSGWLAGVPPGQ